MLVAPRHSDLTDHHTILRSRLSIVEFRDYYRPTAYLKNNNFPGAMQVPIQTGNDIFLQNVKNRTFSRRKHPSEPASKTYCQ